MRLTTGLPRSDFHHPYRKAYQPIHRDGQWKNYFPLLPLSTRNFRNIKTITILTISSTRRSAASQTLVLSTASLKSHGGAPSSYTTGQMLSSMRLKGGADTSVDSRLRQPVMNSAG